MVRSSPVPLFFRMGRSWSKLDRSTLVVWISNITEGALR
jgi:hypothetical protein